jgi:Marseilleviridae restriction endonuclease
MKKNIPFEKSFASHPKSKYWSNNNKLKPHEVYKSTAKDFLFNCDKCYHEFEKRPNDIVRVIHGVHIV